MEGGILKRQRPLHRERDSNIFNECGCAEPKEAKKMKKHLLLFIVMLLVGMVTFVGGLSPGGVYAAIPDRVNGQPGAIPDYFSTPNWAISPALTKFINPLPAIPIAKPDIVTYPGSDYYEIELREYSQLMHTDLVNQTPLRGYVQTNQGTDTTGGCADPGIDPLNPANCTVSNNTLPPAAIQYLGPIIVSAKDRPVRVKFTNRITPGSKLFLPVDTTIMGSGEFEINYDPQTKLPSAMQTGMFSQNRATLHLHGGRTPWISDGTTHQWITPVGEGGDTLKYPKGVSVQNVPDMPDPGTGSQTFYWTNQQSARLLFYHDHAWGITRLNVYAGEAAGYLITDDAEQALINGGALNGLGYGSPLVIQDKTFVDDTTIKNTDPTWAWGSQPWNGTPGAAMTPVKGDLWWPHVYMPAQNPYNPDMSGISMMGRWMYGPWFWPPTPLCFDAGGTDPLAVPPYCVSVATKPNPYYDPACDPYGGNPDPNAPIVNFCQPPEIPGTPDVSWGAEAFLDTMLVNGVAYPTTDVPATQMRFRVLNASHDRFLNLQFYVASPIISSVTVDNPGSGYTFEPTVTITGDGTGATAAAVVDLDPLSPTLGQVVAIDLLTVGSGYTTATVNITGGGGTNAAATANIYSALTEVGMVPASTTAGFPATWPTDGREGGVPDPARRGPAIIQIATEGGFLPAPVLLNNQPVRWNMDPTMFNVGNVLSVAEGGGTLFLAPAERADIVVDFTNFAGKTLILYNDAPTAFPALDPHYDYYTGAPDRTDIGGAPAIPPGVGPNVRTVMQITVAGGGSSVPGPVNAYNATTLDALKTAFKATAGGGSLFKNSQPPIIVGQRAYNSAYNLSFPSTWPNWGLSRISDNSLSFMQPGGTLVSGFPIKPKAIHDEMGGTFDDYGRMSAKLGLEVPFSNAAISTFALQNFVDPATEILSPNVNLNVNADPNGIQIWKITHNGVDTHPIHFHLFDVQVINRVGWDGFIRLPDENELGWKDTVRMAPLEDTIVALRAVTPVVPFAQPDSVRPLNPMTPLGSMMGFSQIDPLTGAALATPTMNEIVSFNHEYVWHCHILSHEENDMMRPIVFQVPTHSISGKVTNCGGPASGINVVFGASNAVATTDAVGNYTLTGLSDGWYKVAPSANGSTFVPAERTGTINGANVSQVNFTLGSGFSVSGTVRTTGGTPLPGVAISLTGAANDAATTDAGGNYAFGGLCSGSYVVRPTMAGQSLSPLVRGVAVSNASITGQDFTVNTYSISGTIRTNGGAAISGATVTLGGASAATATTAANGTYTFTGLMNGAYTVTPNLAPYTFSPLSRNVTVNNGNMSGQNFTGTPPVTYSISGTIRTPSSLPISGVTVNLTGAANATATTNASGVYTFTSLANGAYTVTPTLAPYTFSPLSRNVTVNNGNMSGQDFTGTPPVTYSISGTIRTSAFQAIAGATVNLTGAANATATTNASGVYTFTGLANGAYTVTPTLAPYTFSPLSRNVTVNNGNMSGQNFTGTAPVTYSISGTIRTPSSLPISGVTVNLTGAANATATTNASGVYTFTGLVNGAYTVTPTLAPYTFSPVSRNVTVSGGNRTGQNFTGTAPATYSLSGTIRTPINLPVAGVTVTLTGAANATATTNASGGYTFTGLVNGAYTVTPTQTGRTFTPLSRNVTVNNANAFNLNFTRN
jgi:FtsP/CotA-like multicopper oxidase with cupredoxin domain